MRGPGILLTLALAFTPAMAQSADKVRIGFISSLSNPSLAAGPDLLDGFRLGLEDSDPNMVELIVNDDQGKPDVGVQVARKLLDEDKVQLVTGIVPSNIMLAVAHAVLPRKIFVVSVQAGPSQFAGAECDPYFFAASDQTDTASEAMGRYVQSIGLKRVYLVAANYAAGRDIIAGFKRSYKGEIAGETYTPLGQLDYAAELAELRTAKPDGVFYFEQSGNASINFVKQFAEAGLKDAIPLFGVSTILDRQTLPGMGDAAIGVRSTGFWGENLDNDANRAFIAHFNAKYHRGPSEFSAFAYDGARLIVSALKAVDGHIERTDDFRAALRAAKFDSVRGTFKINRNGFPIQSVHLLEVKRDAAGAPVNLVQSTIQENVADSYVGECKMP